MDVLELRRRRGCLRLKLLDLKLKKKIYKNCLYSACVNDVNVKHGTYVFGFFFFFFFFFCKQRCDLICGTLVVMEHYGKGTFNFTIAL